MKNNWMINGDDTQNMWDMIPIVQDLIKKITPGQWLAGSACIEAAEQDDIGIPKEWKDIALPDGDELTWSNVHDTTAISLLPNIMRALITLNKAFNNSIKMYADYMKNNPPPSLVLNLTDEQAENLKSVLSEIAEPKKGDG